MRARPRVAVLTVAAALVVAVAGGCGSADNGGVITPRSTVTSPLSPTSSSPTVP